MLQHTVQRYISNLSTVDVPLVGPVVDPAGQDTGHPPPPSLRLADRAVDPDSYYQILWIRIRIRIPSIRIHITAVIYCQCFPDLSSWVDATLLCKNCAKPARNMHFQADFSGKKDTILVSIPTMLKGV